MERQSKANSNTWQAWYYKAACSILAVCLFAACKTSAGGAGGSGAELMKSEEAFFASVLDHTFRFNTLSAPVKIDIKGPQKEMRAKAQLKIICDDRIQLSVQPFLGIEVFRIELTNDSVKILDRMNKRYLAESYGEMKGKTDIDFNFHNLQSLFTNNIFIPGERRLSSKQLRRFRITKDSGAGNLKIKDQTGLFYTFTTGKEEELLSTSINDRHENHTLTWDYSDFQMIEKQRFPLRMKAGLTSDRKMQGTVTLTFSTPEIDRPLKTDFTIPSGYTRVTFSQIIKSLDLQ
jgi:hypothetical protein